jgi:TusA-related sulfurtransferase
MSDIKAVDARGLSCPEPALRAKRAMRDLGSGRIEVIIDNGTARDNVERVARLGGWSVEAAKLEGEEVRLLLEKS